MHEYKRVHNDCMLDFVTNTRLFVRADCSVGLFEWNLQPLEWTTLTWAMMGTTLCSAAANTGNQVTFNPLSFVTVSLYTHTHSTHSELEG